MIHVSDVSEDPARPWLNLIPIVEFLEAHGNTLLDGGFILNPDGWRCRMSVSLDLEGIRENFILPKTIFLSDSHDSVLDKRSWCVIEGPGAHPELSVEEERR
jgi:hypothetical protein